MCFLDSICTIITVFQKYAEEDGDYSKLSRRKMKELIQTEFADVIAKPRDPQTIDKILWFLEWDGDGEIDFNEFLLLVCRVAKACYWYLPRGPLFLQKTKLTASGKTLQEPEINIRGRRQHLQEEEQQTRERNHHPPCEPELQRDTRVNELETREERGNHHQQRNARRRNDATRSSEPREAISQEYEERSQEPRDKQRRGHPQEANRRDVQLCECRSLRENEPGLQADERQNQEELQQEQRADVRSRSQTREPQPRQNRWSSRQPQEPAVPADDRRNQWPQETDRGRNNEPHQPVLLREERNRNQLRELEQKEVEYSSQEPREPECLDSRCPHQSYVQEPLELDLRYQDTCESERDGYEEEKNKEEDLDYPESEREIRWVQDREERDGRRRREPMQERTIVHQRELDLEVIERRSEQTRERREEETREREGDGRRQRESVRYERSRETAIAAAEADVKVQRVSREVEPREDVERRDRLRDRGEPEDERRVSRRRGRDEPMQERTISHQRELDLQVIERCSCQTGEREEREATTDQREIHERREREIYEPQDAGRRQRESVRYERTQETAAAAAEADVKIQRVSREIEPREVVERKDHHRERGEPEDARRICPRRETEEPVWERTISRQRELDLEVIERRSEQTRERREEETRDREGDGRRQRESVRYERSRETAIAAAEADVKVQRVSREVEPREDVERRDHPHERRETEDKRRICPRREREEPVQERTIIRQQEPDLGVVESRSCQKREREEREATTDQREIRERRERGVREPQDDGRRQYESVRYEKTQETDVKIQRVSREAEPREDVERKDCCHERGEPEDAGKIFWGRERKEPVRERTISHQRELDLEVIEHRRRQTGEREERGELRETRERREGEIHGPQDDGRRQHESVRYERTRETAEAAAEADVKIRRVSREVEPCEDIERRDRRREGGEPEDAWRICPRRETEEPMRERTISRQRDLDLEVIERRSEQTRERREEETRDREGDGRRQRESVRYERSRETAIAAAEADVKVQRVSREVEPREDVERRDRLRDRGEPEDERRVSRRRGRDEPMQERTISHQRELDLEVIERCSCQTGEREEREAITDQREIRERREREIYEPQDVGRRQRESVRYERTRETAVAAAEADLKIRRVSREIEPCEVVERKDHHRERGEPEDARRICPRRETEEPVWERTISRQRDLDLEIIERRSEQTRERREEETREREGDGRRQRESVRYERSRETAIAAAEADVKVQRVSREVEPREDVERRDGHRETEEPEDEGKSYWRREKEGPTWERTISRQWVQDLEAVDRRSRQTREREEREATADQRETRQRREVETHEHEDDGRGQHESVRYERSRETAVAAAEADVKIRRVFRDMEPREDVERRDNCRECREPEDEKRVSRRREREEPVWEKTISHQRELDLEVVERRSHQTREREEPEATTDRREIRERREREIRDLKDNGRRERESVRYERTRETAVAAAEADVKIQRVSQEVEPREDAGRRAHHRERREPEDEVRTCQGRERKEPVGERTISRQREQDLEIIEQRSRQKREREEREATTDRKEIRERHEREVRDPQDDGRRQRESVRYERTRETAVAAAEADVKIQRVSQEVEPREGVERRDCRRERGEPEDKSRSYEGREREKSMQERTISCQQGQDLEVIERCSHQTHEREERRGVRSHREAHERSNLQILEEDEEREILYRRQINEAPRESSPGEPLEDQECQSRRLLPEEGVCDPNRCRVPKGEGSRPEKFLYRTVEVDDSDSPPGEPASVSDVRVHYIPAEPDVQPEVQVLPPSCKAENIAYLIHVIQNLNDPEATTYEIVCHQPNDQGPPIYVKKCYVSPQPLAAPRDRSNAPEPRPQRDEREAGEPEGPREGGTPASSFKEKTGRLDELEEKSEPELKEGAQRASAFEMDGVKDDPGLAKTKEDRSDSRRTTMPDLEEEHQPQGDGSKAARESVPQEPESSFQVREREDRERKRCPPLPQTLEPREAAEKSRPQPSRKDEASHCHEDVELAPPVKGRQLRQEETTKRRSQQVSDSQPQQEEEPRHHTKQRQGPPAPQVSREAEDTDKAS
ncbi:trichohyalin [Cuculus canorus]|uniref:trichohyalin n=1 Tax=Cuculus canorus TaxID=55661 RepID=UPI0023AB34AA|nr:trichohyalin [Cuculus canorus]